jgi:uncharacterized protein HemX
MRGPVMKIMLIVFGVLAAGIGGAVVVKLQMDTDNSRVMEMRQKDIEAMRKSAEELQKKHPDPFRNQ